MSRPSNADCHQSDIDNFQFKPSPEYKQAENLLLAEKYWKAHDTATIRVERETDNDFETFKRIKKDEPGLDMGALKRLKRSIEQDPCCKIPKMRPRWYKYRLSKVKAYALCIDNKFHSEPSLVSKYLLARMNGSEL